MKTTLLATLALVLLVSCNKRTENASAPEDDASKAISERAMIRTIDVNLEEEEIGIQLNGDRAQLVINPYSKDRIYYDIPYPDGLALLEQFYSIKNAKLHRGKKSDDRYDSKQHIVNIYDEMPEHYSDEWIDYIYPKEESATDADFSAWLAAMKSANIEAQQAGTGQPVTRPVDKPEGGDKPQPEAEGRDR